MIAKFEFKVTLQYMAYGQMHLVTPNKQRQHSCLNASLHEWKIANIVPLHKGVIRSPQITKRLFQFWTNLTNWTNLKLVIN